MAAPRHATTVDQHRGIHEPTGMVVRQLTEVVTAFSDYSQDRWADLSDDDRQWWADVLANIHAARVELASLPADRREAATAAIEAEDCSDLEQYPAIIRREIREAESA